MKAIHENLVYFLGLVSFFFLVLTYFLLRNIRLRTKAEKDLILKNEETTSLYNELVKTDDELKKNMYQLMEKQEQLKRSEQRYRIVMESTMDIIWEGDLVNNRRVYSSNIFDILGYEGSELESFDAWYGIIHPDDREWAAKCIKEQFDERAEIKSFEYRARCKNGEYKWLLASTKCEYNEQGQPIAAFGAYADITELKEQQEKINNMAYYDSVTGLPNRTMLRDEVLSEIKKKSSDNGFTIMFVDLDNFKFINDSYGHTVGDKLLAEVGDRLNKIQDEKVMAFRLGGDEFIIFIKEAKDKERAEKYSKELIQSLAVPIYIDGNMFIVTHSSGIVFYPDNGLSFDELLKNADTAMYISKGSGRNTHTFYDNTMGDTVLEKIRMQADMHKALENEEFVLYYQPIVDVAKERIKGVEALIRWRHPEKGLVFPDQFISLAEESGMIIEIGKWVMVSACKYAKAIHDRGLKNFYISVNVSIYQLLQADFTEFVLDTIKAEKLPAELLCLEITESVLMESMDIVIEKLKRLREHNIKIALDDFGCGYCSLTYLRRLPIDIVKIDRSFIMDIQTEEDRESLASTIILLAKQLGLSVVGEGIEIIPQLEYLKKHSCDMFQGYLVSKPVPEKEMNKLMMEICPTNEDMAS